MGESLWLFLSGLFAFGLTQSSFLFHQAIEVASNLPEYTKVMGISGNANKNDSDTMNNLMELWLEEFKKFYPLVNIQIEGKGSSPAPPALIEETAQFGPMSCPMKVKEIDAFESKYGFKPTVIWTFLDAVAVFVHKDNPLKCLSLAEVDAVFSKNRKRNYPNDITTWDQLGLSNEWNNKPFSIYGRKSAI